MRTGIDITSVDRLRQVAQRHPGILARIFTADELVDAGLSRQRWPRLAARFAAKEALIKAAGGLHGSSYRQIVVRRQPKGPPIILTSGPLSGWLEQNSLRVVVTLSHEDAYAVAWVMLEIDGG